MYKLFLKALDTLSVKQNTTLTWVTFMLCKFQDFRDRYSENRQVVSLFPFEGFLAASAQVWALDSFQRNWQMRKQIEAPGKDQTNGNMPLWQCPLGPLLAGGWLEFTLLEGSRASGPRLWKMRNHFLAQMRVKSRTKNIYIQIVRASLVDITTQVWSGLELLLPMCWRIKQFMVIVICLIF